MSNPTPEAFKEWEKQVDSRWKSIEQLEQELQRTIIQTQKEIKRVLEAPLDEAIRYEFRGMIKAPASIDDRKAYDDWMEKTYAKIPADLTKIPKELLSQLAHNIRTNDTYSPGGGFLPEIPSALTREKNAAKFQAAADPTLLPHLRAIDESRRAKFEEKRRQNRVLSFLLGPETQK